MLLVTADFRVVPTRHVRYARFGAVIGDVSGERTSRRTYCGLSRRVWRDDEIAAELKDEKMVEVTRQFMVNLKC